MWISLICQQNKLNNVLNAKKNRKGKLEQFVSFFIADWSGRVTYKLFKVFCSINFVQLIKVYVVIRLYELLS